MDAISFADYKLFCDDLSRICLEKRTIINTLNPHSFCLAENDETFRRALKDADILLPDGVGIVWACRLLTNRSISRISGMDVFRSLLKRISVEAEPARRRIFFLGASPQTLKKIKDRVFKEYPSIELEYYSPPYREKFSTLDRKNMVEAVQMFKPHVLFVGMTAPKQEKWVYENHEELQAKVICSIGAVFDYYAGTIKRPGPFWRRIGLEWLIRFLREPKRLWRRNLISGPHFVLKVLKLKLAS